MLRSEFVNMNLRALLRPPPGGPCVIEMDMAHEDMSDVPWLESDITQSGKVVFDSVPGTRLDEKRPLRPYQHIDCRIAGQIEPEGVERVDCTVLRIGEHEELIVDGLAEPRYVEESGMVSPAYQCAQFGSEQVARDFDNRDKDICRIADEWSDT